MLTRRWCSVSAVLRGPARRGRSTSISNTCQAHLQPLHGLLQRHVWVMLQQQPASVSVTQQPCTV